MKTLTKTTLYAATLLASFALVGCANVVRVAPHTDLKVLDPVWTTAYITRNHGYLVYDTLFSLDESFEPQPQMVNKWTVSDDKKTWTFTLRDGLKWHDGTDVTAADCVASLERWGKRDGVGQQLFRDVQNISVGDAKTFTIQFKEPNTFVLEALAKVSANVPFMMPKRVAETDPFKPIQDTTGSGPFIFKKSAWEPGSKAVYVKNSDYVPRTEPQSLAAGGKVAKADRIEWIYYPDQASAVAALVAGKVDYVESPSTKSIPVLEGKEGIVVTSTDPLGNIAMVRFNTLLPPFDKPAVRRAVLQAMQQEDYMAAALGNPSFWRVCHSVFPCGTPLANDAASDLMKPAGLEAAKKALRDAGYDGTPVVILNPVDSPVISAFTKVTVDKLRNLGMTVRVEDMTWAALTERRANREAVGAGGWNIFHTWWLAADVMDPMAIAFSGDRTTGWYGWPNDPVLEDLRGAYVRAKSANERKQIAMKVQKQVVETGVLGVLGQFFEPVAYSTKVKGITTPVQFYWNMYMDE
ncbi:ABC transporter substrate-binding protein [Azonexus sp. IMCC34842]|uniref:ABC transporter substrate-binding protein n=1 Tax=Azonexus sp. IMCC34842 TaxID=3420950 RepID=UPI003D0E775D